MTIFRCRRSPAWRYPTVPRTSKSKLFDSRQKLSSIKSIGLW